MVDVGDLLGDIFYSRLLNSINFERVFGATLVAHVTKKHFVIIGPVLVSLLEKYKAVN